MFDMVVHLFTRNLLMFYQRPPATHLITPSSRTSTREVCSRLFMLKMSRLLGVQSSDSTGAVAEMSTPTFFHSMARHFVSMNSVQHQNGAVAMMQTNR